MASFIKLKNTPIKEIIFTISFNETVPLETLDRFKGLPDIVEKFIIVNQGFNMNVEGIGNQQPVSKTLLDGYVLRSPQLSRIIQARRGSFSFHKVAGYEAFDTLMIEFQHYWDLLNGVAGNLTVNNLSVRYLNFIAEMPGEEAKDLITIYTTHPFGGAIEGYLAQFRFKYDKSPDIVVNVVTAKGKDGSFDGTVLDIMLNKPMSNERNSPAIFDSLAGMREVKNDIFFRSITEKAIQKFNQ